MSFYIPNPVGVDSRKCHRVGTDVVHPKRALGRTSTYIWKLEVTERTEHHHLKRERARSITTELGQERCLLLDKEQHHPMARAACATLRRRRVPSLELWCFLGASHKGENPTTCSSRDCTPLLFCLKSWRLMTCTSVSVHTAAFFSVHLSNSTKVWKALTPERRIPQEDERPQRRHNTAVRSVPHHFILQIERGFKRLRST